MGINARLRGSPVEIGGLAAGRFLLYRMPEPYGGVDLAAGVRWRLMPEPFDPGRLIREGLAVHPRLEAKALEGDPPASMVSLRTPR